MLIKIVGLAIGVLAVMLVALALQGAVGGEWTYVAQKLAMLGTFIVIFAVVIAGIYEYRK
jgi:hypothetical protein